MSRGLGVIEKSILEYLSSAWEGRANSGWRGAPVITLAVARLRDGVPLEGDPTPALAAAVRRALASLLRKGIVRRSVVGKYSGRCRVLWRLRKAHKNEQRRAKARERYRRRKYRDWVFENSETPASDQKERRLAHILGMLGSAHDGEVLAAVRQAEQERQRLGKTWLELLGCDP